MPRKIRELIAELERAGFYLDKGGKGSHRKFRHDKIPDFVLISGKDGEDARSYQEKHVKRALASLKP